MIRRSAWLTLAVGISLHAAAAEVPHATAHRENAVSALVISPIFSQLVAFNMPLSFHVVNEETSAHSYIREAVLQGETVDRWTQMITVTGYKDVAAAPGPPPAVVIHSITDGFNKACPDTFSTSDLGQPPVNGYPSALTFVACGSANEDGVARREAALILAIKGTHDYYTIQWAERGPAQASRVAFDPSHWTEKLKQLTPVFVCNKVPGEQEPYLSCISHRPSDEGNGTTTHKDAPAKS